MDSQMLLHLHAYSHLSPNELANSEIQDQLQLYSYVAALADEQWRLWLLRAFEENSDYLQKHINELEITFASGQKRDIAAFLFASLVNDNAPDSVILEARERVEVLRSGGEISDPLMPAIPLA